MTANPYDLSHDDIQKVMSNIEIPSCPKVVTDTLQEAQKDDPDITVLAKYVVADPGMSAAAIKLANSAAFGRGSPVSGVKAAIDRLGIKNLVCVVIASALRNAYTGVPDAWLDTFWKRTLRVAVLSSAIARRQFGISPDAAFTYGLFHDGAIPLMVRRFPDYMSVLEACVQENQLLIGAEQAAFPCTHPVVGALLVKNWGLPGILGQAIRFHHDPEAYDVSDSTLSGSALAFIAITQVAEHLQTEAEQGVDLEVGALLFARACAHLGLSDDELDALRHLPALTEHA